MPMGGIVYRVEQVATSVDQRNWHLIRQSVYLAEQLLTSDDVGDSLYTDKYDPYSLHYLVREAQSGSPVASARLIIRDEGRPLQVEEQFEIKVHDRSAEISGFAVMPKHRSGLAAVVLIRALLEELRSREIEHLYAEVEPWFFEALRRFGYPITQISDSKFVYNAENFVFYASVEQIFGVAETASAERQATVLGTFYSHPWEWEIGHRHLAYADD